MPSEGIDDAGVIQRTEVHHGHEDQRARFRVRYRILQLTIDLDLEFSPAAGAFRPDAEAQRFVSELPLHEGQCNRVNTSGSIDRLTGAESHPVGRPFGGNRIGPNHRAGFVAVQKGQFPFQFIQDGNRPLQPHAQVP